MNKETPHFIFREKKFEENYREFERLCEKYVGGMKLDDPTKKRVLRTLKRVYMDAIK